jgi:short-subunit dehydrogenase
MSVAVITGASAGLGRALARELARRQWELIIDARHPEPLDRIAEELRAVTDVTAIAGDVSLRGHQEELARAVERKGSLDLLVNNASTLGPTGLHPVLDTPVYELTEVLHVNVLAPVGLLLAVAPYLAPGATVVNISSDAAVAAYPGWGGYGASKAALDHLTATLAAERPDLHWYALDPGDMRTAMHQAAFPGEDISDRPLPEQVVPDVIALIEARPPSGRYRAAEFAGSAPEEVTP